MVWQFLAKTTAKAFFPVRTDGIQTSDLLFDQLASAKLLAQYFRIIPKIIKKPAGELIDAERLQPIGIIC